MLPLRVGGAPIRVKWFRYVSLPRMKAGRPMTRSRLVPIPLVMNRQTYEDPWRGVGTGLMARETYPGPGVAPRERVERPPILRGNASLPFVLPWVLSL
jgi:hypothetical protein